MMVILEIVENMRMEKRIKKEGTKMKKLIMVVMAFAMAAAFVPMAEAGDSAQLGLTVTFAPNDPVAIRTEPEGPFKIESGKELVFMVRGDYTANLKCESHLPEGATFTVVYVTAVPKDGQGGGIFAEGTFKWTPKLLVDPNSDVTPGPIELTFAAIGAYNEVVRLVAQITVVSPQPVISIELNESAWRLDGIKLGELRDNLAYFGSSKPLHMVKNTGNIPAMIEIGYAPSRSLVQPGIKQDVDRFITGVGRVDNTNIIPVGSRMFVGMAGPGEELPLWLTYGAPTKLSQPVNNMDATYELRAYPITQPTVK